MRTLVAILLLVFVGYAFLSVEDREPQTNGTSNRKRPVMEEFIGANSFIDDPIGVIRAVGFVREYHDWRWDEGGSVPYEGYPNNAIKWAPSYGSMGGWNFDKYYKKLKDEGIGVSPVTQGAPPWLQGGPHFNANHKPLTTKGASATNPASYAAKAHHMYQYAARYGRTTVPEHLLTLADDQPRVTGLGLVNYLEDWNEPNRYWQGRDAMFLPEEYAAMASADYDGHCGTLKGGTFGVKNADPTMKLVMGGIAGLDINWIIAVRKWFTENRRDKKFAADVINVHHYAWKNGKNWQGGGPARSPEEDNFRDRMEVFTLYRDKYLPDVEVWVSEFGWDTHPESALAAPSIGPFDTQEVQGQWLVRAYLAFAAAGVDKAQMYMLRDVAPSSKGWFNTCGLVGAKGDWKRKKSWYYVYTLKSVLTGLSFMSDIDVSDSRILAYKFGNDQGKEVYVVWAGTRENYEHPGFSISVPKNSKSATLVKMEVGSTTGVEEPLKIENGEVRIDVSERPVFVVINNGKAESGL